MALHGASTRKADTGAERDTDARARVCVCVWMEKVEGRLTEVEGRRKEAEAKGEDLCGSLIEVGISGRK